MWRSAYRMMLRLHPPRFRTRFEDEMLLLFDDAADRSGLSLAFDALLSLLRQWILRGKHWGPNSAGMRAPAIAGGALPFTFHNEAPFRPTALACGGLVALALFFTLPSLFVSGNNSFDRARTLLRAGGTGSAPAGVVGGPLLTPATQRFWQWMDIYNNGDAESLEAFYRRHLPDDINKDLVVRRSIDIWRDTFNRFGRIEVFAVLQHGGYRSVATGKADGNTHWRIVMDIDPGNYKTILAIELSRLGTGAAGDSR